MTRLRQVMDKIKELGLKDSYLRAKRRLYKKSYLMSLDLETYEKRGAGDAFAEIDPEIIKLIRIQYPKEVSEFKGHVFTHRWYDPDTEGICYNKDGHISTYIWALEGKIIEESTWTRMDLKEDEVYLFDLYTFVNQRGKGLGRKTMEKILEIYKDKGFVKAYLMVGDYNTVSIAIQESLGFKKIAAVYRGKNKRWFKKF